MSLEHGCFEVASAGEPAHLRTFQTSREGKIYTIKLSFPGYLQELKARNAKRPPSARADENIFVFNDVVSAQQLGKLAEAEICQRLAQMPDSILQSYLTEQRV